MERRTAREFGARADGRTLDTQAIQAAIDACSRQGGGTVVLTPGVYLTAPLRLRSDVILELQRHATLLGSPRLEDRVLDDLPAGILFAQDAEHIRITGEGTIDGNVEPFIEFDRVVPTTFFRDFDPAAVRGGRGFDAGVSVDGPVRPRQRPGNLVVFSRCRDVRMDGVTVTGSSMWTIHCADCRGVELHDLDVTSDPRTYNTDGIHLTDCRDVRISRCRIATGDDCIAISGQRGLSADPADAAHEAEIALGFSNAPGAGERIAVSDCTLSSRSSAVRIWSLQSPVRDVSLRRLTIDESNRGIGIFLRSEESIRDITIEDVRVTTRFHTGAWWGWAEPLHISAARMPGRRVELGEISRIRVRRFQAQAENGLVLYAHAPGIIRDVVLEDITLLIRAGRHSALKAGHLDLRNTVVDEGITQRVGSSLVAVNVASLRARDVDVRYGSPPPPYFVNGPQLEHMTDADIAGWREDRLAGTLG